MDASIVSLDERVVSIVSDVNDYMILDGHTRLTLLWSAIITRENIDINVIIIRNIIDMRDIGCLDVINEPIIICNFDMLPWRRKLGLRCY